MQPVRGDLALRFGDGDLIDRAVIVDYERKKILLATDDDDELLEITATEAVDQAEIVFAILHHDAQFLKIEGRAYIQAKLTAMAEEDHNTNGQGVSETRACLYWVDSAPKKDKKIVGEPKDSETVRFYLNQSFLRTQGKGDRQLWHAGLSAVAWEGSAYRIFGSVLYEECGSDEVRLNMFSAELSPQSDSELAYP